MPHGSFDSSRAVEYDPNMDQGSGTETMNVDRSVGVQSGSAGRVPFCVVS